MDTESTEALGAALGRHDRGAIIILELPKSSFDASSVESLRFLTSKGMEGIYISIRRPLKEVRPLLEKSKVGMSRLLFISLQGAKAEDPGSECVMISGPGDTGGLIRAVQTSLKKLKSAKKFIYLDTLDVLAASVSLAELMKLSEFFMRLSRKREAENIVLAFDEAYPEKQFITGTAMHADEIITSSGALKSG